jgi:hypothetical protein
MKKIILLCTFVLFCWSAQAQLDDGTIAPDFVATDLQGNTWHLYDILNQGKSVVIDISATWCGPCWNYHQSGALEELYAAYGPNGTNELMVFLIEGDPATGINDLYGTTSGSQGNWVEGTPYPIMDFASINNLYQINYFPTLYVICPDKLTRLIEQSSPEDIHALTSACPAPVGNNNAAILKYQGFSGDFCNTVKFPPAIYLQNMGTDTLRSAEVSFLLDNALVQTIPWTGNLPSYATELVAFDTITIQNDAQIAIVIGKVNGVTDDVPSDNAIILPVSVAPSTNAADITLELKMDNAPGSIYWEITDDEGHVVYYGGNRQVKYPNESSEDRYQTNGALYNFPVPLPSSRCYNFGIYDLIGNGLCCSDGNGYYKLKTPDGQVLAQGALFGYEDIKPFGLNNSAGTANNASLTYMVPLPSDFCKSYRFAPKVKVLNTGNNPITSLKLKVTGNTTDYDVYTWNGNLQPYNAVNITLDSITLTSTDNVVVSILALNGQADIQPFKNSITRSSTRRATTAVNWVVDITTDALGHETYWQLSDASNTILYSGGNPLVGPGGGGLGLADPSDPGAYNNGQHSVVQAPMPGAGCYKLLVVDDGGNGINLFGFGQPTPFVRLRNPQVGIIAGVTGNFGSNFLSNIEILGTSATAEAPQDNRSISLSPNPASAVCELLISNPEPASQRLLVFNIIGEKVVEYVVPPYAPSFDFSVAALPNGLYQVQLLGNSQNMTAKLMVQR